MQPERQKMLRKWSNDSDRERARKAADKARRNAPRAMATKAAKDAYWASLDRAHKAWARGQGS